VNWDIRTRQIYWVVCRQCGKSTMEWWGWSQREAILTALELGWSDGLCEDCYHVQKRFNREFAQEVRDG